MTTVTAIQTGTVQVRPSHLAPDPDHPVWRRLLRIAFDKEWAEPLPIYTYLIEHSDGLILFDAGEIARAAGKGYLTWWHPFFRRAVRIAVEPEEEVGARLRAMDIDPRRDLKALVISHLHHDHADGLHAFEGTRVVVTRENLEVSKGFRGKAAAALPQHWPAWFDPDTITMTGGPAGPFESSYPLTDDGTVFAIPTPGHMPGHMSLVVRTDEVSYLLTGDATMREQMLRDDVVEGTNTDVSTTRETLRRMREFAKGEPTVLLPAHDPLAPERIRERRVF